MKLSKEAEQAKRSCKNANIKDGYQDCWVVNFKSHPVEFVNKNTGERILLNYGYGIKRYYPYQKRHRIEANEDNYGKPIPYNSYYEALSNLGIKFYNPRYF